MEQPEIMTLRELAEVLRIAPSTVYRELKAGTLPGFKVARDWKFARTDIQRWIERKTKQGSRGNPYGHAAGRPKR